MAVASRLPLRPEVIEQLREELTDLGTPQLTLEDERFLREQFGQVRAHRGPVLIAA